MLHKIIIIIMIHFIVIKCIQILDQMKKYLKT